MAISSLTTDVLQNKEVLKYLPASDGNGDYWGFTQEIPPYARGHKVTFQFNYKNTTTTSDDDFRFCIKEVDGLNAGAVSYFNVKKYHTTYDNGTTVRFTHIFPSNCKNIKYGWQNKSTTTTIGMNVDNIAGSTPQETGVNPLTSKLLKATNQTGVTITFSEPYVSGLMTPVFRNGNLMKKVATFSTGSENYGREYQEVAIGANSTQITLHSAAPAVVDDEFTMVTHGSWGSGLNGAVIANYSRIYADGTDPVNASITSTPPANTKVKLIGWDRAGNLYPDYGYSGMMVIYNGQIIERSNTASRSIYYTETIVGGKIDEIVFSEDLTNNGMLSLSIQIFNFAPQYDLNLLGLHSSLIPAATNTYNLGSDSNRWKDLHLSGSTLFMGGSELKYDATAKTLTFKEVGGTSYLPLGGLSRVIPYGEDLAAQTVVYIKADGKAYKAKVDVASFEEIKKIQASDKEAGDYFGTSVAMSGDYIVAGAYSEDPDNVSNAGAAYVFKRVNDTTVTEIAKIQATDPEVGDNLGNSVDISGDYIVAGASEEDTGFSNAGAAYVFKRFNDTTVTQIAKIQATDKAEDNFFGYSVAISGDYIVAGAFDADSSTGAAYVFKRVNDTTVTQIAKIQASDKEAGDFFGQAVAISGDYIVVGANGEDTGGSMAGAAYVFKRVNDTTVTEIARIQASDREANDYFGYSVAISGDYIVVGANGEDTGGSAAGAAYVFKRVNDTTVTEIARIQASDREANDKFGTSVAISGGYIVVGALSEDTGANGAGAAYVFKIENDTTVTEIKKIQASDPGVMDFFGTSVTISGYYLVSSARHADTGVGAAYVTKMTPPFQKSVHGITTAAGAINTSHLVTLTGGIHPGTGLTPGEILNVSDLKVGYNVSDKETVFTGYKISDPIEVWNGTIKGTINEYTLADLVELGTYVAPEDVMVAEATVVLREVSSSAGTLKIAIEKSLDNGVTWADITGTPGLAIPVGTTAIGSKATISTFTAPSLKAGHMLRFGCASIKDTQGAFHVVVSVTI